MVERKITYVLKLFQVYKYTHNQDIATSSAAQMLANMLYAKRFFPYSVTNILVCVKKNSDKTNSYKLF